MKETYFREIKRFVRFDQGDARRLKQIWPLLAPELDRVVNRFYERLLEHEGARAVLVEGEPQIERLKGSLKVWLREIFSGPFNEAYYRKHQRIGRTHVRVGLPQHYMLTAMNVIRLEIGEILSEAFPDHPRRILHIRSVHKVLDMDLAIMLETYHQALTDALRAHDREENLRLAAAVEQATADLRVEELQARKAKEFLEATIETTGSLVVFLDVAGRIVLFNRRCETTTGYTREEVLGQSWFELFIAEENRPLLSEVFDSVRKGTMPSHYVNPIRTRDGSQRIVAWTNTVLQDPRTGDDVVVAIGHDITELKAAQAKLAEQEAWVTIGRMAASLAHEIRNPLAGIGGAIQTLIPAFGPDSEEVRVGQAILQRVDGLNQLVNDLLLFARPLVLHCIPVTPRVLLNETLQILRNDPEWQRMEVEVTGEWLDRSLPLDPQQIQLALTNLLVNSAQATDGKGRISVSVTGENGQVYITVADSGPGIPPESMAEVFKPFFTTKRRGTGLGLSNTRKIIETHGGSIAAGNQPGGGARFVIRLPVH
ncbi:MAG: PAS domain S-box protein [Acidobacteria bacterium]|nr:PAS domain S-box protein [Acidobacteriota bacterium]